MIRTEEMIRKDIAEAQAFAQTLTDEDSVKEHKARVEVVKGLQKELADFLASGAKPCSCGGAAFGMLKTPEHGPFYNEKGEVKTPYRSAVYAVGCAGCGWGMVLAGSPEKAVETWNKNH